MDNESASVSVVIPCYDCAATLPQVLDALLNQTHRPLEIIVVNDDSPDELDQVAQPYLNRIVYLQHERNMGVARACSDGLRSASGDYLMTLHTDCILDPDYIEKLLHHLQADPAIGVATGQYLFSSIDELTLSNQIHVVINRLPLETTRDNTSCEQIAFVESKADLFRRQPFEELGFFKVNPLLAAEDQDTSVRLRQLGFTALRDNSCRFLVEFTATSDSLKKVLGKQWYYALGQAYIVLTHPKDAIVRTTAELNRRAVHRAAQLFFSVLLTVSVIASVFWPPLLAVALMLAAIRGAMYFAYGACLKVSARMLCIPMGIAADFCYLYGMIEGTVRTLLHSLRSRAGSPSESV